MPEDADPDDRVDPFFSEEAEKKYAKRFARERIGHISKEGLRSGREEYPEDVESLRPKTRGECQDGIRPCPFVSCSYHLYLDVHENTGSITYNYPEKTPDQLEESCALDVADRGPLTLEEVGDLVSVTRERVRQLETIVLKKLRRLPMFKELIKDGGVGEFDNMHRESPMAEAMTEHGGVDNPMPEDPHQEWIDNIWRIYERSSREQRIYGNYTPPPEATPSGAEDVTPTASTPLESPMTDTDRKIQLSPQEEAVLKAYLTLSESLGGKPRPIDVYRASGLTLSEGSEGATVCNALNRVAGKGVQIPFYYQNYAKSVSEHQGKTRGQKRPRKHLEERKAAANMVAKMMKKPAQEEVVEEELVEEPALPKPKAKKKAATGNKKARPPSKDTVPWKKDGLTTSLIAKKIKLQEQIKAIDMLLKAM